MKTKSRKARSKKSRGKSRRKASKPKKQRSRGKSRRKASKSKKQRSRGKSRRKLSKQRRKARRSKTSRYKTRSRASKPRRVSKPIEPKPITSKPTPSLRCIYTKFNNEVNGYKNVKKNYNLKEFDKYDNADVIIGGSNYRNEGKLIMVQYIKGNTVNRKLCNFGTQYDDYGTVLPIRGFQKLNKDVDHNSICWITIKSFIDKFRNEMKPDIMEKLNNMYSKYQDNVFVYYSEDINECEDCGAIKTLSYLIEINDVLYYAEYNLVNMNERKLERVSLTKKEVDEYEKEFSQYV